MSDPAKEERLPIIGFHCEGEMKYAIGEPLRVGDARVGQYPIRLTWPCRHFRDIEALSLVPRFQHCPEGCKGQPGMVIKLTNAGGIPDPLDTRMEQPRG